MPAQAQMLYRVVRRPSYICCRWQGFGMGVKLRLARGDIARTENARTYTHDREHPSTHLQDRDPDRAGQSPVAPEGGGTEDRKEPFGHL